MIAHYSFPALLLLSLFCFISITKSLNNGFSMELIHRDSPKSPFYNPSETQFQRVASAVRGSINRTNRLNKALAQTNTPEPTVTSATDTGGYFMSFSVGTPPFKVFAVLDTGSDLVWLQCKPCKICYNQNSPIFDPSKSKTYKTIPCSSSKCQSLDDFRSCSNNTKQTCDYTISYGDTSTSQGDLGVETLTLESTNGSSVSFPNIVIGCGRNNRLPYTFTEPMAGVVGLVGGPLSLITQMGPSICGKFSYCLVPMFPESNTTSKLNFGDAAIVSEKGTVSTPIVDVLIDKYTYPLVTLEAFSVGNKRIELRDSSSESIQEGNTLIDSGTTLTLLPRHVYYRLESAVKDVIKDVVILKPVEDPTQLEFGLCYETTSVQLEVPIITAHFKGADVPLNALNIFIQVNDTFACFAFAPTPWNSAIFGNLSQQNLLVGYDLQKKVISFKPTDCSKH